MTQFVVVGAGPAGCSAALKAARLPEVQVKVIEKRSFETIFSARNSPRSYPMVLSGRALGLFEDLGLELPSTREPYYGIEFLPSKNSLKFPNPSRCALVSRSQLALNLLHEAALHPSISIYFGASPTGIDVGNKTISLEQSRTHTDDSALVLEHLLNDAPMQLAELGGAHQQDASTLEASMGSDVSSTGEHSTVATHGEAGPDKLMSTTRMAGMNAAIALQARKSSDDSLSESLKYDFLVGADGAFSKVREILNKQGMLSEEELLERTSGGYKTFTDIQIPRGAQASYEDFPFVTETMKSCQKLWFVVPVKGLSRGAGVWPLQSLTVREGVQESSITMRIVLWRSDSDHICGMVPGERDNVLDAEITPTWMRENFGSNLPEWFLQPFCDQMNASPTNSWGSIVSVSQFHAPNVVLLGDSAHAVTSALGQGCNMALESVRVFGNILEECIAAGPTVADALVKVPEQFTAVRERDARAMQRMELLHSVLQGGNKQVDAFTAVHARIAWGSTFMLGAAQWKLMPNRYNTLPIYEMIYDENVPYSDVLAYVNRIGAFAYGLLAVAMSAVAANIWQLATAS